MLRYARNDGKEGWRVAKDRRPRQLIAARGENEVKITGIRTVIVHAEMRNWIFVRVDTDQAGLFGWGEATLEWKTRAVDGAVSDIAPLVIGRDPRDIEKNVRIMKKHGFWRLGAIGMSADLGHRNRALGHFWQILGVSRVAAARRPGAG